MIEPTIYDRVRLVGSQHERDGAPDGTVGYIIDVYEGGAFEIEVSNADGTTVAQFVAHQKELEVANPGPHESAAPPA